jgi:hypothetical protein
MGKALEALTDDECATLVRLLERAVGPSPSEGTPGWLAS